MGVLETAAQGIEADGAPATRIPQQSELLACLHARPDRRRLSRGGLVSFLRAAGARTNHPATLDQRRNRSRIRLRQEPHSRFLGRPARPLTKVLVAASSSPSSPREERVGRGPRRGETNKNAPPLRSPLLHPTEEREKSRSLMQPCESERRAKSCARRWGVEYRVSTAEAISASAVSRSWTKCWRRASQRRCRR